ncbi:MAG: hypothetical protein LQ352_005200 [Teloschistes flavicans]|nr:MAG: hypothetical protein LQ352_005200 [Teloschistes flavicans]
MRRRSTPSHKAVAPMMNVIIQNQLDRIETALNTLITSIESYNPSVPAAIDLLAADTALQEGVKQLTQHQINHARILRLRSTIEAQNQQITSTLTLLANTRKELLSTPATVFPENSRSVPYTELLDYAKKISPFTVPPTFREPTRAPKAAKVTDQKENATPVVNGVRDAVAEAREASAVANGETTQSKESKGVGESSLEQADVQWLNPLEQIPFVPWPTEEVIKRGALGQIQVMLEQGFDPGSGEIQEGNTKEGKAEEAIADIPMGEAAARAPMIPSQATIDSMERRADPRRREEKPKVFKGLDLDEDSDED